jgi:YidC/Oxa1 family membrane protein insertase
VFVLGGQRVPLDGQPFRLVEDTGGFQGGARRVTWELAREDFTLRKTYSIPEKGNLIGVEHELMGEPEGLTTWGISWAGGLRTTETLKGQTPNNYFQGMVRAEGKVQRKPANALEKGPIAFPGHTYFVGVQNKYFLATIVPRADHQGPASLWRVEVHERERQDAAVAGEILVDRTPGVAANRVAYDVYIGPLDFAKLASTDLGIEDAVDLGYSWVRPLSEVVLKVLIALHKVIPNYGLVIILFSAAITLLFFPLTYKSAKSMRDMAALKPRLDALKQKYPNDPQKLSEATMKLYKEARVNPFGGCFPLLLQMPIFFALYAVLFHTIELRGAPFFGWISDLSQPDVIFHLPFSLPLLGSGIAVLPIIMGVTSYFQSKQTVVDPSQKMMVYMMPVVMTFVFFSFPSGLVLYWLTNNVLMIAQKALMKPSPLAQAVGG